ncbi:hypothetical protein CVT24_008996 [Panaeolus cyanescens]|uniref:Copper transporter n=1 Tax=Panaeolus cyanescens TaxID=181874 RepID=A0A409YAR0_9AGAR|nr:hypothetical protein CVT24_008996 [Panaeolus cyanescens]
MKFNVVAAVVAAAALAEAAPLRVLMISSSPMPPPPQVMERVRLGHPVPLPPDVARMIVSKEGHHHHEHHDGPPRSMRRPCGGRMGRMKEKALEISNAFRQALGLPLIEPPHGGAMHHAKIIPTVGTPTFIDYKMINGHMEGKTRGGEKLEILPVENLPHPHPHHGVTHHMHSMEPPFFDRLQFSLMNLGVWEAAAVSFVLGCGIGVLLRMFYVLTVLAIRSFKGHNDDEIQYAEITIIEDYDDEEHVTSPPPTYAYPIDEKHAEEVDAKTTAN